jgi:hypothetical protein
MIRELLTHIVAAKDRLEGAGPPMFIFIDEGHRALTPAISTIFEMARFRNISIIFSCPSLASLRNTERDYADTILNGAEANLFMGPYADKVTNETVSRLSGDIRDLFYTRDGRGGFSEREALVPRIGNEKMLQLATTRGMGIAFQAPSRGLAQYKWPTIIRMQWPQSREEYEAALLDPWPGDPEETIVGAEWKEPAEKPAPTVEQKMKVKAFGNLLKSPEDAPNSLSVNPDTLHASAPGSKVRKKRPSRRKKT